MVSFERANIKREFAGLSGKVKIAGPAKMPPGDQRHS
jgi:hypothetical protein